MEKVCKYYLGIDVSKLYFDVSLLLVIDHQAGSMVHERFDNTPEGVCLFGRYLKKQQVPFDERSLVVMENTGVYHRLLWQFCSEHGLPLYIGNASHIKNSFGLVRGKNDKIDSQRLCRYAFKHDDEIRATQVLKPVLLKIKDLMTARANLIKQQTAIRQYLSELHRFSEPVIQQLMRTTHQAALEGLKSSIKQLELQIDSTLKEDTELLGNYQLLRTVPGIGHFIAVYLLCWTGNFAGEISGKQLACYAGVAPFGEQSGSSIRRKNKVHKMANKDLKRLLHMGALSVIRNYPEFKDYYERKTAEGKHSMTVLNAIRNKIALRAVSVIKRRQAYVDNYQKAA